MDMKEQIEATVKKVTSDPELMKEFQKNPKEAVKKITGLNIPDEAIDKVITAVKAKIGADKAGNILDGIKKLL